MEKNNVRGLEEWTKSNLANWLGRGFRDLNSENDKQQLEAFFPFHYRICFYNNSIDGLKSVYDELSEETKRNFRWGVREAFSELFQDNMYIGYHLIEPVVKEPIIKSLRLLLYLASRICVTEIIPVIVDRWTILGISLEPEGEEQKDLFALSLDVVSGMAPYPGVAKAIRKIVNSGTFRPIYSVFAPMLFVALCRTEPEKFPSHLELLRQDFSIMHKKTGRNKSFITARRFSNYVSPDIIAEHLWELNLPEDEWFMKALFVGKKAPLKIVKR